MFMLLFLSLLFFFFFFFFFFHLNFFWGGGATLYSCTPVTSAALRADAHPAVSANELSVDQSDCRHEAQNWPCLCHTQSQATRSRGLIGYETEAWTKPASTNLKPDLIRPERYWDPNPFWCIRLTLSSLLANFHSTLIWAADRKSVV